MRSAYLVASLLLFSSLLSNDTQGIRLEYGIKPVKQGKKILAEASPLIEEGFRKITLCKDGHCDPGKNRKLLTATSSSPSTTMTRNEDGEKKANPMSKEGRLSVTEKGFTNSQPISENVEAALEHYPDLVDIAEMDYSPAKRKPPIHN